MKLESAIKSSQDKETELQGKLEETNKSKTQVKEKREREGRSDMEVVICNRCIFLLGIRRT